MDFVCEAELMTTELKLLHVGQKVEVLVHKAYIQLEF